MASGADVQCGAGMRGRHTEKCTDFVVEKNIGRDLGNVCRCSGARVSVSGNMCRRSKERSAVVRGGVRCGRCEASSMVVWYGYPMHVFARDAV